MQKKWLYRKNANSGIITTKLQKELILYCYDILMFFRINIKYTLDCYIKKCK